MLRRQDQDNSLDTKLMRGKQVVHCLRPNLVAERMERLEPWYCWQTPTALEARYSLAEFASSISPRRAPYAPRQSDVLNLIISYFLVKGKSQMPSA